MNPRIERYRVWIGWYSPNKFHPKHWTENPRLIVAAIQISEPVDRETALAIAQGYNQSEMIAIDSIDASFTPQPRMWAFVVDQRQEIENRKTYRLGSCDEPSFRLAPSLN